MVRLATYEDVEAIGDLLKQAHEQSEMYRPIPFDDRRAYHSLFAFIDDPKTRVLVTEKLDGVLIGEVGPAWEYRGMFAFTHIVYVSPGVNGKELIEDFINWAKSWDAVRKIQIPISFGGPRAERAGRFLSSLGMKDAGKTFVEIV